VTTDPVTLLLNAVRAAIEAHDLLPRAEGATEPPESVIVGVSGGPDSVALLHVLWRLAAPDGAAGLRLNIRPIAAHLNHGLRGADADADQQFVEDLAGRLGLPYESARADVAAEAAAAGLGTEETARLARRRFLADVARHRGARLIALGHHADDRAETILFNILRGTGIEGLASLGPRAMLGAETQATRGQPDASASGSKENSGTRVPLTACPPVLPANDEPSLEILRPLITVGRDEILAYLAAEGLTYRQDSTNASDAFTRNRIRGDLLPLLRREFNPQVDESLLRLSDQAAAAGEVLADALDATWRALVRELHPEPTAGAAGCPPTSVIFDAQDFAMLRPWMQGAILRRAIERLGGGLKSMSAERTREVLKALLAKPAAGPVALPGHLIASRRRGAIRIERKTIT
jgi:tRNA(Ile)-lysidine synthase